jgi:hypothetical protein
LLIAPTTVARLPSPTATFVPVTVPVRNPPANVPVIVPAAAFNVI